MLIPLYSLLPEPLAEFAGSQFPAYRIQQLFQWLYRHFRNDPDGMYNLPGDFRQYLKDNFSFSLPAIDSKLVAPDGSTKYRLKLEDGARVESVLIPEGKKRTLCISSQVGCGRKCTFCSTGKMGLIRNLEIHEIVGQIVVASRELYALDGQDAHLTNLVLMGMGEPFDNREAVFDTLRLIQHPQTLAISPRRTTVSTCGVIPGIIAMADSGIKAKLAVSLNAAIDAKRRSLMPINRAYPLTELKQALLYFRRKSKFRITLEYVLIPGVNMAEEDLRALRKFVGDLSCKINFIPYNPGQDSPYQVPSPRQIEEFMVKAQSLPQAVTLRRSRGAEVFGACGQLGYKPTKETKK